MPASTPWIKAPKTSHIKQFRLRLSSPGNIVDVEYKKGEPVIYAYDNLKGDVADKVFLALCFNGNPGVVVNEHLKKPGIHFTKLPKE